MAQLKVTPEVMQIVGRTISAVLSAVEAGGAMGAPSGIIYAALSSMGMEFNHYQCMMSTLVEIGLLRLCNNCYFLTDKGREILRKEAR